MAQIGEKTPIQQIEMKTQRYVQKMPYLKALIFSELVNDVEIYRYINTHDIQFQTGEVSDNFLNGLRGGMNELFTDFKKQFEKLSISADGQQQTDQKPEGGKAANSNYSVSIMYDQYYVRKREIIENVLMVAICDIEKDGLTMEQAQRAEKEGLSAVDKVVMN